MSILRSNVLLAVSLICVPVLVELVAAAFGHDPGIGLDVLLYWPFDFAFPSLALLLFAWLNAQLFVRLRWPMFIGVVAGAFFSVFWFILAFLAVAQLHISRGGQL